MPENGVNALYPYSYACLMNLKKNRVALHYYLSADFPERRFAK
jgi:hypothetical protein